MHVLSHLSHVQLCDPLYCSLKVPLSMGILQARILQGLVMLSSRGSSQPRDQTRSSYTLCIGSWVLYQLRQLGSPKWQLAGINLKARRVWWECICS